MEKSLSIKIAQLLKSINHQFRRNFKLESKELNLTMQQMTLVFCLMQHEKLKVSDISKKMKLSPSTVSVMVDALVRKGLVKRCRGIQDRRVVYIALEEKTKKRFENQHRLIENFMDRLLEKIPTSDTEEIIHGLQLLDKHLKATNGDSGKTIKTDKTEEEK